MSIILGLAASQDRKVGTAALRYFLDNLSVRYPEYDPNNFGQIAFVPSLKDQKPYMAKPSEVCTPVLVALASSYAHVQVYASPEWATMGFATIDPSLRGDALSKLKIREHPPTAALVNLLQRSPPPNDTIAREWFSVLAGRIAGMFVVEYWRACIDVHH